MATITRRDFLRASAALGVTAASGGLLAACAAATTGSSPSAAASTPASALPESPGPVPSQSASGSLTYLVGTGALADAEKKAWLDPFSQQTGIAVVADQRDASADLIKAAVETGQYTFDCSNSYGSIPDADLAKYFEPLDFSVINRDDMYPQFVTDYWIAIDTYSWVLGYNTDATKGVTPNGWADLFDLGRFPGKRSFEDSYTTAYAIALMADGVAPADLVPYDVPRAQKKLATIKDKIIWFKTGTEVQELLASGEAALGVTFNGRAKLGADEGHPVKISWPGQIVGWDRGVVLKGTPAKAECMQFFAYVTGKDHSGELTKYIPYPPGNKNATLDPASREWVPTAHFDVQYWTADYNYWNSSFADLDPGFQDFKTS
jgi:putative spermidine/putrescine transport system substrate-binding protein